MANILSYIRYGGWDWKIPFLPVSDGVFDKGQADSRAWIAILGNSDDKRPHIHNHKYRVLCRGSDNVRKYFDVTNRAFLCKFMRDFDHFYAQSSCITITQTIQCENHAFWVQIMRDFSIQCAKSLNHASRVPNPIAAGVNPGFCRVESGETFYFNMFRCHHSRAQLTIFSEFSLGVHPGFMLSSWWSLLRYNKRLVSYNI